MRLALGILGFILTVLPAQGFGSLSARRPPGLRFEEIMALRQAEMHVSEIEPIKDRLPSILESRFKWSELETKIRTIPRNQFPKNQSLQKIFEKTRDERVLASESAFPRRATWLYPDDGCFARAELVSQLIKKLSLPAPYKIYAFGNLYAKTPNTFIGSVSWWYHVAVGYWVDDEIFVFDSSIDALKPLSLARWNQLMGGRDNEISICDSGSLELDSACWGNSKARSFEEAKKLEDPYLAQEWMRVIELNRNPEKELGISPPWKTK